MKLLLTLALAVMAVGCGYSSKATTPPTAGSTPVITGLVPNSANNSTTGGGVAFTLEVDGNTFGSQATVSFNGTSMAATWVNSGKLQVMIPASAIATAGKVNVTVTNPGTQGGPYGGGTLPETSNPPAVFTVN